MPHCLLASRLLRARSLLACVVGAVAGPGTGRRSAFGWTAPPRPPV